MTQEVLGALVGISKAYVSQLETGARKDPSGAMVEKLANVLAVKVSWLLGISDNPSDDAYPEKHPDARRGTAREPRDIRFGTATYTVSTDLSGVPDDELMLAASESMAEVVASEPGRARLNAVLGALLYLEEIQRRCVAAWSGKDRTK